MSNTESKLISAVLKDKQVHVLLQANVQNLMLTHGDIWSFIRTYFEKNGATPPTDLVVEKFRDFTPVDGVGATKYHLEELQAEFMNISLKELVRTAAADIQADKSVEALERLISKTAELKKNSQTYYFKMPIESFLREFMGIWLQELDYRLTFHIFVHQARVLDSPMWMVMNGWILCAVLVQSFTDTVMKR